MTDKEICSKIHPRGKYILVKKLEKEKKSGSIVIPEEAQIYTTLWKVLKLGDGLNEENTRVREGDLVVLLSVQHVLKFPGIDDQLYLVDEEKITAVYEEAH